MLVFKIFACLRCCLDDREILVKNTLNKQDIPLIKREFAKKRNVSFPFVMESLFFRYSKNSHVSLMGQVLAPSFMNFISDGRAARHVERFGNGGGAEA